MPRWKHPIKVTINSRDPLASFQIWINFSYYLISVPILIGGYLSGIDIQMETRKLHEMVSVYYSEIRWIMNREKWFLLNEARLYYFTEEINMLAYYILKTLLRF